ncbi:MAG TPA: hypothetical protein VNI81_14095, partial [Candidatus Limnocylindrales bacterium]|nr:hypothetical protein [Candidatus Limnocylindrales bacterium]
MATISNLRRYFFVVILAALAMSIPALAQQEETRGAPAEPTDADETRAQIDAIQKLLPNFPDRAAALYAMAAAQQHFGESREALKLLKECIALREGFDPSGGAEFAGLRTSHEFTELVEK